MLRTTAAAIALLAAALAPATALAQTPNPDDFRWRAGATDLPPRVEALGKQLTRGGVADVLASANRPATANGPCASTGFPGIPAGARWYCFDPEDSGSLDAPDAVEWVPQGVTTAADSGAGPDALLVSWYDSRTAPAKGVRVSFLDPATNKYRHVLLVYPTADGSYEIVGRPEGGVHAGGIAWYGSRLYVADTRRGVRVFDMSQIFDLSAGGGNTTDKTRIGRHGDTFYGFGYRYVMPQVGAWVNNGPDNDGDFTCAADGAPKYSSVAVDSAAQRLVTSEYCDSGAFGRVARWPLDPATGDPVRAADGLVHAAEVQRLPVHNVQGAVSAGDSYYLGRSRGSSTNGQLIPATPSADPAGTLRPGEARAAGIGPEDLSYWPARDELWTVTEHAGRRMLYGVGR